jgi:pyruvate formate lyase activating enzyme
MAGSRADGGRSQTLGRPLTVEEALAEIEKDVLFYDDSGGGVTFSGGEPLAQPGFLKALLEACRRCEIHTAVDTSGYAPQEVFEEMAEGADLLLFDLKLMNDGAHRRWTGVSNELILENFRSACRRQIPMQVRVPLVCDITDARENIGHMADFLRSCGYEGGIGLLPYHRIGDDKYRRLGMANAMQGVPDVSPATVKEIRSFLAGRGFDVTIGG